MYGLVLLFRLDVPQYVQRNGEAAGYVYDEIYHVFTAHRILLKDPYVWRPYASAAKVRHISREDLTPFTRYEWVHPPLAELITAFFLRLFGWNAFAARIANVIFALVLLALTFYLARMICPDAAGFSAFLLGTDGVFFVLARTGIPHMFVTTLMIGALCCTLKQISQRCSPLLLITTGALLGCACSIKWTAAPLCALMVVLNLAYVARRCATGRGHWRDILIVLGCLLVIPAIVYLLSYSALISSDGVVAVFSLQEQMYWFHSHLVKAHPHSAPWYLWPLMFRPVEFFSAINEPRIVTAIWCIANPVVWLTASIGTILELALIWRRFDANRAVLLALILAAWLPWSLISRFGFFYYLLPALPLATILVGASLQRLGRRAPRWSGFLKISVAVASLAMFINLYPLLSAWPTAADTLDHPRLSWIRHLLAPVDGARF